MSEGKGGKSKKALYLGLTIALVVVVIAVAIVTIYPQLLAPSKQLPEQEGAYVVVQDMVGRTVKVPKNVQRVVTTLPDTLRLVMMLNATNLVVGITSYVDMGYANKLEDVLAYPELLNPSIARVGAGAEIDREDS